jgi:hypothetical protein
MSTITLTALPERYRQQDFLPEDVLNNKINIIGAGGIGSITTLALTMMGFKHITVYDMDKVEAHNMASQLYGPTDIGTPKVVALKQLIERLTGTKIKIQDMKVTNMLSERAGILILAVDSMDMRIKLFDNLIEKASIINQPSYIIDARMGGETANIYAVHLSNIAKLKKELFPSTEAVHIPCTAQAIAYNTFGIASLIGAIIKKIVTGDKFPFETNICLHNFILLSK